MERRGFLTSDGITGSAGVNPQVHLLHLIDVVHRPVNRRVFERPEESCHWEGVSRAAKSDTLFKLCSIWYLKDSWFVRSIWTDEEEGDH